MRTAPLALAYLDDEQALVEGRSRDQRAHPLRFRRRRRLRAVDGRDPPRGAHRRTRRPGAASPDADRRDCGRSVWTSRESSRPADIDNNGGRWPPCRPRGRRSSTRCPAGRARADHLRLGLDAAVRAGNDTDTVAAIAGGLLGAVYGASAVPLEWRGLLHGWPGCARTIWSTSGRPSPAAASRTRLTSAISTRRSTPWRSTRMTTRCCSVASACCASCRPGRRGGLAVPAGRRRYADDMPHVEVRLIDRSRDRREPAPGLRADRCGPRRRAAPRRGAHRAVALRGRLQPAPRR